MSGTGTTHPPFLKVILPAAAGLILAPLVGAGPLLLALCSLFVGVAAWVFKRQKAGQPLIWLTVLLFFMTAAKISEPRSVLHSGERITAAAQVRELPSVRGRWQHTIADVGYYRTAQSDSQWAKVNERIILSIDTSYRVEPGMQIAFRGWVNPVDDAGSSYGRLMKRRGIHKRIYLTPGNMLRESPHTSKTPSFYASRLHMAASRKIGLLNLSQDAHAVVAAMTIGQKSGIEPGLRQKYNLSGGAHLLAVSGLHVGIVFLLINVLLYLLPSFRHGHIIKNIVAVAAIWLYGVTAGLAPSVVRAALMFSFAQLALASSSKRNALNIMLGSAFVMLAIDPNLGGDPSFLLSYTAVLSIMLFFNPVYRLVATRFKPVNALSSIVIVGLTATVGTAPLVSYWFGNFSLIGILVNPAVILTAHIIVLVSVLWLLIPGGALAGTFSFVLEHAAQTQNKLIEWSAAQKWAIFDGSIPFWGILLCYLLMLSAIILITEFVPDRARQRVVAK